jgi:hypothetical protein
MNAQADALCPAMLGPKRIQHHFFMGYHHDHDGLQDRSESPFGQEFIRRAECLELQPLEVRRMLWEGATLVQCKHPHSDSLQGAILLAVEMGPRQIRALLPDITQPLLCVGLGRDGAVHASAVRLAEHLLNLGYRHVFCLASGIREMLAAGA